MSPLTNWQSLVLKSSDELAPAKLNEALDKKLAFVTSNLALVATVATGFGLFSDLSGPLLEHRGALKWTLGLLIGSVVVSLVGSAPNWWGHVDVNDLDSVATYFKRRYIWRAWAARVAILMFTCAVAVGAFTVWSVVDHTATPMVSLRFSSGDEPSGSATVAASELSPGTSLETTLTACSVTAGEPSGGACPEGATVIARDATSADSTGKAEVELSVIGLPPGASRLTLVVSVGAEVFTRSVDFPPLP